MTPPQDPAPPSTPVRVLARFVAKPGAGDDLHALIAGLLAPTRAEPGCIEYRLWREHDRPEVFTLVESWESAADLDRHLSAPHLEHAKARLPDLLAEPLEIIRLAEVG